MRNISSQKWAQVLVCVCAVSVIATPASAIDFIVNSVGDRVDLVPGDGVCETSAGNCSLRAAIQEANANPGPHTITLGAGVFRLTIAGAPENAALSGDLDILQSVTIQGAGIDATIVDGLYAEGVFQAVAPGLTLTFEDMTIRNGNAGGLGGGAISAPTAGITTLTRVRFENCYATSGGAVSQGGGNMIVNACEFVDNFTTGSGGAIYKTGATPITIDASEFVGNVALGPGGAVHYSGGSEIGVQNSLFDDNLAGGPGGGVHVSSPSDAAFTDCAFMGCNSDANGGAIYVSIGGSMDLVGTAFDFNDAGSQGGAVYMSGAGSCRLETCEFSDNEAQNDGGGLYVSIGGNLRIRDGVFARNVARTNFGGGLRAGLSGSVSFSDTQFLENSARNEGGGAWLQGHNGLTITRSLFSSNAVSLVRGGGLYESGSGTTRIQRSQFLDNRISTNGLGGGLYSANAGGTTIERTTFARNEVSGFISQGGGMHYQSPTAGRFENVTFSANIAGGQGGGASVQADADFVNCTFAENSAVGGGAAMRTAGLLTRLQNCILANSLGGINYVGFVLPTSLGNNIDQDNSAALAQPTDQNGVNPRLEPLMDNGGGFLTHALMGISPAIDAGNDAAAPAVDERGIVRPIDGNGDGTAVSDIGAFEFADCNTNGVDDTSEITRGLTPDCNSNGIPDNCESPDTDGDGVADQCDTCTDTDGDGFGDPGFPGNTCTEDNCPTVANPDQADSDGDGVGDACTAAPPADPAPGCGTCAGPGILPMFAMCLAIGMKCLRQRRRR